MRFFRQFWKQKKPPKSVFGGEIKSQEEVSALNQKIVEHEKKEEVQAEKLLEQSKHLWKE
jgi:hypothetical protein